MLIRVEKCSSLGIEKSSTRSLQFQPKVLINSTLQFQPKVLINSTLAPTVKKGNYFKYKILKYMTIQNPVRLIHA